MVDPFRFHMSHFSVTNTYPSFDSYRGIDSSHKGSRPTLHRLRFLAVSALTYIRTSYELPAICLILFASLAIASTPSHASPYSCSKSHVCLKAEFCDIVSPPSIHLSRINFEIIGAIHRFVSPFSSIFVLLMTSSSSAQMGQPIWLVVNHTVLFWHADSSSARKIFRTSSTLSMTLPASAVSLPTYRGSAAVKRSPMTRAARWGSLPISSSELPTST